MLCFIFAALIVVLDQLFKQWVILTLSAGGETVLISGVISLIYTENSGAAFSILADQRWLISGIAFVAVIVLVAILLRYNDGFWGTIGLASVLGGAVGNLIDRVLNGYVVDMFNPLLFPNFAIFNVADVFITLGCLTFAVHFIIQSIRSARKDKELPEPDPDEQDEDPYSIYDVPDRQELPDYDGVPIAAATLAGYEEQQTVAVPEYHLPTPEPESEPESVKSDPAAWQEYYRSASEPSDDVATALSELESLESELSDGGDYDVDKMLREYGFEDS